MTHTQKQAVHWHGAMNSSTGNTGTTAEALILKRHCRERPISHRQTDTRRVMADLEVRDRRWRQFPGLQTAEVSRKQAMGNQSGIKC